VGIGAVIEQKSMLSYLFIPQWHYPQWKQNIGF
jgi:hypothetical protein